MHYAAENGYEKVVQMLLNGDADGNVTNEVCEEFTLLM